MHLSQQEIVTFFRLWIDLIWGINEKHTVVPHFQKPVYGIGKAIDQNTIFAVSDKMWDNPEWMDEFIADAGNSQLSQQDKAIIQSWRNNYVKGTFIAVKQRAKGSILIQCEKEPPLLYMVSGISESIKDTLLCSFPVIFDTILIPFGDRIIYYGFFINRMPLTDMVEINKIQHSYQLIKSKHGVIETLPANIKDEKEPQHTNTAKKPKVPLAMMGKYEEIAAMLTSFFHEKLNDEYLGISLHALEKLCRKRPSPIGKGWTKSWACGIAYAICSTNFIFDPTNPCHMSAAEIASWFGVAKSSASNKSSQIIGLLQISRLSREYMIRPLFDEYPVIWM